ncbi:MAG TPA: hypothetical protein VE172_19040 [Stackebrandtia sp.]|jgi:hypothetical protein|uniref:hypothetical protein n=1 Tax=Stackebrandtia sp. TaxID=2023065 RepID=UPI002D288D57|nr:hypothetical protein [Stackebrandtia sp.]HZE40899.1 hypothetical protein [Stackebrandtia sp.]
MGGDDLDIHTHPVSKIAGDVADLGAAFKKKIQAHLTEIEGHADLEGLESAAVISQLAKAWGDHSNKIGQNIHLTGRTMHSVSNAYAQLDATWGNAVKSDGPTSDAGKAISDKLA